MGWNRLTSLIGPRGLPLILVGLFAGFSTQAAKAQGVYAVVENQYIRAKLGESGTENNQNVTGRFVVEDKTTGGTFPIMLGPVTALSGVSQGIPVPGSFLTLRIDGGKPKPGPFGQPPDPNQPGWDLLVGEDATDLGAWALRPTELNGKILARWVTVPGPVATNPVPPIEVNIEISLVHDMVCYKFTVINGAPDFIPPIQGTQSHTVGLRFAQHYFREDTGLAPSGPVLLDNGPALCTETLIAGTSVPTGWRVTGAPNSIGGVLKPQTSLPGILPDQFLFGSSALLDQPTGTHPFYWDYTFSQIPLNFCNDTWDAAVAVYWSPRQLPPNQAVDFTTYFGRRNSSINFDRPWAAGIEGPESLSYDPSKPVGQQLTPNPFAVRAFAQNLTQTALTNVTAVINLPNGLALAAGQNASQSVATLDPNNEALFNWSIVPTGTASGRLTYSVSFSAGPGAQGKVVTRSIDVPALPSQTFQTGLQMVSFPYNFADPTPAVALGIPAFNFDLLRWVPTTSTYEAVTRIIPGEGYWLNLRNGATLNLVGATPVPSGASKFEIRLQNGWQQIGNPFLLPVRWQEAQVVSTDVGDSDYLVPITLEEAGRRGWLQPVIFRYDPADNSYKYDLTLGNELIPFQGYWLRANRGNLSLLIAPPVGRAAKVSDPAAPAMSRSSWSLRIQANAGRAADTWNFIGVSSDASDGPDRFDFEKPPAAQGGLTIGFPHTNWGNRSGVYTRDIQSVGGKKQWDLVVTSPSPNTDVTLSWPEIGTLPKGTELYITDKATGVRSLMRQKSSVRVNTGEDGRAAFTITAMTSQASTLRLTGSVVPGRGPGAASASIRVQPTQDATISVRILGATGQTIRTIGGGRAATAGSDTVLTWDYKDSKGAAVPSGTYTIDVKAVTPDGQAARLPIPHIVVR